VEEPDSSNLLFKIPIRNSVTNQMNEGLW